MNLSSIFGYGFLETKNIQNAFVKMTKRSQAGGLLHTIAFFIIFSNYSKDIQTVQLYFCTFILALGTLTRVLLSKYNYLILHRKHGLRIFRSIFTLSSMSMMLVWSVCISFYVTKNGFNAEAYLFTSTIIAIAGLSTSAFAFDLLNNILCQLSLLSLIHI